MISTFDLKKRADDLLFQRMEEALRIFLQNEAPLYRLDKVGVVDNFQNEEIIIKLHIKQRGSAHVAGTQDDEPIRYIGNK